MNNNEIEKKVYLPESDIHIALRTPSLVKFDKFVKGFRRGELNMIKATEGNKWATAEHKAYCEMLLPISVLQDETLNAWCDKVGTNRWEFLLLHVFNNLMLNKGCKVNAEIIRYAVGEPNAFFTTAIIVLLEERIKQHEIVFINALNMAKYHLREYFIHPKVQELSEGFINSWIKFSLGFEPFMLDWGEVVQIVTSIEVGNSPITPIPTWIVEILYATSPARQFIDRENDCKDIAELLRDAGYDVLMESQEAAFGDMFEPVAVEKQPIPRGHTMRGNGRRELAYKNGFTFPKSKRRW